MKPKQMARWLEKQGCTLQKHKGGSGHLTVRRDTGTSIRTTQLPMHGSRKELRPGVVAKIKKNLGFT